MHIYWGERGVFWIADSPEERFVEKSPRRPDGIFITWFAVLMADPTRSPTSAFCILCATCRATVMVLDLCFRSGLKTRLSVIQAGCGQSRMSGF
jgi:hypothetical protein